MSFIIATRMTKKKSGIQWGKINSMRWQFIAPTKRITLSGADHHSKMAAPCLVSASSAQWRSMLRLCYMMSMSAPVSDLTWWELDVFLTSSGECSQVSRMHVLKCRRSETRLMTAASPDQRAIYDWAWSDNSQATPSPSLLKPSPTAVTWNLSLHSRFPCPVFSSISRRDSLPCPPRKPLMLFY